MDRLADWFTDVYARGAKPLTKSSHRWGRWFGGLLNYFKQGVTNTLSEAINSKINTMVKKKQLTWPHRRAIIAQDVPHRGAVVL